ncbi:MAG TPA: NAD(P)H-hydrate dehydratase [Pyrinomonadaceae bacterium]|nr:NAD(P)H-hydrate dehydratase [Pyrinomonadaceae bacterium]
MQKIVTAEEMREIDRLTTERYGIPQLLLMENAAHATSRVIVEKMGGCVDGKSVLILCGKGNNGGDGAALGRILWQQGADVEVCLFGLADDTKNDAKVNFEILRKITEDECFELSQSDLAFAEITSLEEWLDYDSLNFHCDDPDVLVDALFGTGLTHPLDGVFEQVAAFIDAFADPDGDSETLVVSIDVPSGLCSDNSDCIGANPRAHATVTFTAPKIANVLPPAANCNGELHVENIGSPCNLVADAPSQTFLADAEDVAKWFSQTAFTSNSYKNKRGHALLIAGAADYSGAAVLCGNAAIRSGVGVVTIATPESSRAAIIGRVAPEVMVRGIPETNGGAVSEDAFDQITEFSSNVDVIAIGSGLSSSEESTRKLVRRIVEERTMPVVIDADGLNALAPFDLKGSDELPLILTPHAGEFKKLAGLASDAEIKDRVACARSFAQKHHVILVLKGERVLIAEPTGRVIISPTGNSGLGKAGNGDTLTGIIAGFVGQAAQMKASVCDAVIAAVYVGGLAGDIAQKKFGKRMMTASDTAEALADCFRLFND